MTAMNSRKTPRAKGRRAPLKLSFEYMDTPERRVLSLEPDGIDCIPVVGFDAYRRKWEQAPLHVHAECLEISLCLRGDLEFEMRGERYPFKPGNLFVSGPQDVHRLLSYPKGMSKYWCLFRIPKPGDPPLLGLPPRESRALLQSLTRLPRRLFRDNNEVRRLFKKLFRQHDTLPVGRPERSLCLRATILMLLLAVVEAASVPTAEWTEDRLTRVIGEMRAHPEADWPIDTLAERAALSPSSLLTRFKRLTGMPPHAFLLAQRMAAAKRLLAEGRSVAFVADALGFSSTQHFSGHFKAVTGNTPSAWRR